MAKPTISMPDELEQKIEDRLDYGDSKSGWIRESVRYRFAIDDIIEQKHPDMPLNERLEYVESALKSYDDD